MEQFKCSKLPAKKQIFDNVRLRFMQTMPFAACCPHVKEQTAAWETGNFKMLCLQYFILPLHKAYNLDAHTATSTDTTLQADLYYLLFLHFFTHKLPTWNASYLIVLSLFQCGSMAHNSSSELY